MSIKSCRFKRAVGSYGLRNNNSLEFTYLLETEGVENVATLEPQLYTATPNPVPPRYAYVGSGIYVTDIRIENRVDDSRCRWRVTVTCGPLPPGEEQQATAQPDYLSNPLARWPVFRVEHETESQPLVKDKNGQAITNAAAKRFDEPLFEDNLVPILVISRNVANWTDVLTVNEKLKRSTNSDSIGPIFGKTFPVRAFQFQSCTAGEPIQEQGLQYYRIDIRLRMSKHTREILNRGYEHFDENGVLVKATDTEGQPVSEPVLLAADGKRLAQGADPTFITVEPLVDKAYIKLFQNAQLDPNAL